LVIELDCFAVACNGDKMKIWGFLNRPAPHLKPSPRQAGRGNWILVYLTSKLVGRGDWILVLLDNTAKIKKGEYRFIPSPRQALRESFR
jgi:hypothetical protein